jgi:hypothetical protein
VPHRVQRHIVPLVLPNAKESAYGNGPVLLPFPHLQKGDLAFYLRLENDWTSEAVQRSLQNPGVHGAGSVPLAQAGIVDCITFCKHQNPDDMCLCRFARTGTSA